MKPFLNLAKKRKKKDKPEKQRPDREDDSQKPTMESLDRSQDAVTKIQKKKKKKQKVEREHGEKKKERKNKDVITDERFASMHYDPRFQRMPKKEAKVVVDSRFSSMFTDENFAKSSAPVDKRGRKRKGKGVNPLLHYYLQEEEPKVKEEDERESSEEEFEKPESVDHESSSTGEDDDDDDEYSVDSEICRYLTANLEGAPQIENETHRLAVMNMDWDHIKAVDIYVVMNSCLPKGGEILSVAVYPSEFGLKCMEIEAVHGPSALIDSNEGESDDEAEIDNERLRVYELNRLRYYYAVVVCDSSATANHIYKTLDGTELLKTSNVFDLRFIPDSMEFKHPPREITIEAPTSYKEPEFHTRALQHSKVKLSWEEDEPQRTKLLRRKCNPNQLDEFKDYLASTDEDSDEDDEEHGAGGNGEAKRLLEIEKFRALLQSKSGNGSDSDSDKDDGKDMEITFNTGLEDLSKRILEKRDKKSETVWETVLRKRKEKKAARKKRSKYSSDDESSDFDAQETDEQPDDFFMEEELMDVDANASEKHVKVSKKGGKNKQGRKEQTPELAKEREASKAELELLFAEDQGADSAPKGYNLKPKKKVKGKKGKKEELIDDKLPTIDYSEDPRFSAMLNNPMFALDPTDPQYKRSAPYARQKLQKQSKVDMKDSIVEEVPIRKEDEVSLPSSRKKEYEFSATVRSLKRNIGTFKKQR
ncbi:pre-rRNA-processing protein ESF1 [Dioscorea cayenensis subsp. rotundata]|uniref:Pre-rRNA-processing protein ESF1 n=1 Tax=Dioscorea cayennensis subsp. rotundata TaxID=55577 RepID=A0AB40BM55_DIOCR|nr:pre-rRNA-processing protein ESF1 [Dioscorea cayenensis subsp. rotundata]